MSMRDLCVNAVILTTAILGFIGAIIAGAIFRAGFNAGYDSGTLKTRARARDIIGGVCARCQFGRAFQRFLEGGDDDSTV